MTHTAVRPVLREPVPADRSRIEQLSHAVGNFRTDEILVALEVFDASCRSDQVDYETVVAEVGDRPVGWICWGPTPCTMGTFDLYWMAVEPAAQGLGIGTALVEEMERRLAGTARLIMIDTSGRADYDATRTFYASRGYAVAAVVPDFYAPGDDQVIFAKRL
jgi:GNAT superfamily N-acetyltransferase